MTGKLAGDTLWLLTIAFLTDNWAVLKNQVADALLRLPSAEDDNIELPDGVPVPQIDSAVDSDEYDYMMDDTKSDSDVIPNTEKDDSVLV